MSLLRILLRTISCVEVVDACRMSAELGLEAGAKGPGSLRVEMLDALYNMTGTQIKFNLHMFNHV